MSGVVLAVAVFVVFFLAHLTISHLIDFERKERVLVAFMLGAAVTFVLAFALTPLPALISLGILPSATDGATGLAALGFLILGYVEFWSLIERSFSLRILIDAAGADSGLSPEEMASAYGGGRGLNWMMDKRIDDLRGSRLLESAAGTIRLSGRGRLLARCVRLLRSVFGLH